MSKISKNIRHLRDMKKLTQQQLADKLNITKARLGSYEESRSEPSAEMLVKFSNYFHISIDALLRGDLTKTNLDGLMKISHNRLLFPVIINEENNEEIELITMKASAGYLNGYADPEYVERLQRIKLPFLPAGKHRAFPIKGDSMPPLRDGSFVVGKYVESYNEIKDGITYVLLTQSEGIVYKRVFKDPKRKGVLMMVSDNKTYQPYEIKASDILEVWEYICSLNLGSYKPEELNYASIMNMLKGLQVEIKSMGQGPGRTGN
jgi:transcriptional regulator with XRE-family HTH domain